jgi:hypothetical protein
MNPTEQWEPDIMDLNDWALFANPVEHRKSWFSNDEHRRYAHLHQLWVNAGRPDIDEALKTLNP